MPARTMRTPPRQTPGWPEANPPHPAPTTERGRQASPTANGRTPNFNRPATFRQNLVREGVQPRSEWPALPRRAARIRGGPSCDSKMKALLSKQYRTTRVDPLHSYLATNRIGRGNHYVVCQLTPMWCGGAERSETTPAPAPTVFGFVGCKCTINPRNPKRKRVPPSSVS